MSISASASRWLSSSAELHAQSVTCAIPALTSALRLGARSSHDEQHTLRSDIAHILSRSMHSLYPRASVTIVCGACLHVAKGRVSNFFEFETVSSEPSEPLASVSIPQLVRMWTLSILPVLQSLLWGCSARDMKVLLLNPVPAGACALCNSTFSNAIGRHQYLRLPMASQRSGCTGRPIGSCRWHCNRHLRIVLRSQHAACRPACAPLAKVCKHVGI